MSYTHPANPTPTQQALRMWMEAMEKRDVEAVIASFDDSFSIQILPTTLGQPKMDKATYSAAFRQAIQHFKSLTVTFGDVFEAGTVYTLRVAAKGESALGTPWTNEYIFILAFTSPKDGSLPKIASQLEFVDSAAFQNFYAAEQAAKGSATN
ncbi:hypothetical protein MVEN_01570500 [Mycena venus]|uniref:SnoaL-like domain-containing protein n=1 Tax=Mycena venus TaxID=2733690 RepID=A0A8H7CPM3_9AGAR|nr:hypothetical protein MVEN_01570500 [Mycena venus]